MWVPFVFLFFAETALANPLIWKENYGYKYVVRSRAFTGVSKLSPQFSGVMIKGLLQIRVIKPDTLVVQLFGAKYARVHTELQRGWDGPIPDQELNYIDLPGGNTYKILFDRGNVQQVFANPEESVGQVNMMKGILSHLQFNMDKGQRNLIESVTEGNDVFQTYTIKEQSVTGYCNTTYDIIPVSRNKKRNINAVPIPQLKGDKLLDVMKNRDYKHCIQLPTYQFAMTKEQEKKLQQTYLTRSTKTNMIVSHNTEHCTIWSSIMRNRIQVRPNLNDMENSDISTIMNLTLIDMWKVQKDYVVPENLVSAGNLTYLYSEDTNTWVEPVLLDLGLNSKSSESSEFRGSSSESDSHEKATSSEIPPKFFRNSEVRERNTRPLRLRHSWNEESREREFGHPICKPTLQSGISPLAMGLTGDSRQALDKVNLIIEANRLIHEIATEVVKPDEILEQNTLEKFTIVTRILRQLNPKEIVTVENNRKSLNCLRIFWNALAQAGTGPALLNIRQSIMTGKIKGLEAAHLIHYLPRAVRVPTGEYIEAFFELITTPEVKNQLFLNTTAPFAFAELVRYVMVLNHQYFYPVRTYGTLITDKDKKKLTNTYIPYFANELKKAYDARENNKIVTYTVTLGNLAHKQIISVFEPYLEGKYNITKFQRMMMVGALKRLSDVKPELVRPIVYKIYQNDLENYEVRVAAVQILLNSRPPLQMLQRIAEKTNHEIDPEVNNAVVTGITALTKLQLNKYRDLAKNARLVKPLLNPNVMPNSKHSINMMQDYMNEQKDMSAWFTMNTLANKNTMLPNMLKLRVGTNSSYLAQPDFHVVYATTNVSVIEQMIKELFLPTVENLQGYSMVDDLARKLNVVLDKDEAIEGCVVLNSPCGVHLFTYDQATLKNMFYNILGTIRKMDQAMNVNFTSIGNWETTISYPTEIGLLMNYNLMSPVLTSWNTKVLTKLLMNPPNLKMHVETDLVASQKVMSRLSFATPFDNQRYVSGMDSNSYVHVPGMIDIHISQKDKAVNIVYEPLPGSTGTKLLHRSVVPFTSVTEAVSFTPLPADHRTQTMHVGTLRKQQNKMGPFTLTSESYTSQLNKSYPYTTPRRDNLFQQLMTYITSTNSFYQKTEVTSHYGAGDNKIIFSVNYNYYIKADNITALKTPENLDKLLREMQFDARNCDVELTSILESTVRFRVPNQNIDYLCNVGLLNVERLYISQLIGNCYIRNSGFVSKVCGLVNMVNMPSNCPTMHMFTTENVYTSVFKYGDTCEEGQKVSVSLAQQQSEQVKGVIMNSEEYRQCKKEMEEGNSEMANCKTVCQCIDMKDELSLTIEADQKNLRSLYYYVMQMLHRSIVPGTDIRLMEPKIEKDAPLKLGQIDVKIKKPFTSDMMNVTLITPSLRLQTFMDTSKLPLPIRQQMNSTMDIKEMTSCTLGRTKVLTFDGLEYPVNMMECPYVLMISPKLMEQDTKWDIISKLTPRQANVAVLVKPLKNGQRNLIIVLNGVMHTLEIKRNNQVILNTQSVKFTSSRAVLSEILSNDIGIIELPYNMYKITVKSTGVCIYFNGQRVQLKVDDKYNGFIRGLCGNKDNIKENDLMAPQGCVLKHTEDMGAIYAAVDDTCPAVVQQKRKEANRAQCYEEDFHQTNVVSDLEAGRRNSYKISRANLRDMCSSLRTNVTTEENRICFSISPIEVCACGCTFNQKTKKTIAYHCEPINEESMNLKRRIENGANPDFSTREVTLRKEVEVPSFCYRL